MTLLTRRRAGRRAPAALIGALTVLSLALTGCGAEAEPNAGSQSGDTTAAAEGGVEDGAFPVTIEHKYGETLLDAAPERVVVVGLKEQDDLLALGVVPVATTDWFVDGTPGAIFPWAEEYLGDAETPELLSVADGIEMEKIAGLAPDLIIGLYSGLTDDEYKTLSKIAPVVAQPADVPDYGISWQDQLLTVGQAVGRPQAAQDLLDETEQVIEDARAEHPDLEGKTGAVATPYEGVYVYGEADPRTRLLTDLGMVFPTTLVDELPAEFGGNLSEERVDLLDLDTVIWIASDEETVTSNKLYANLPVHKEARDVFIAEDGAYGTAFSFVTVLSLPYVMERLVPQLDAAADGDPTTEVPEAE